MTPRSDSLRLGFLGHQSSTTAAPLQASRTVTGLAPNPGLPRDPENLQCRAVFIQFQRVVVPRCFWVQPVSDSRHGRIADKSLSRRCSKERRADASNQPTGLQVQPLSWLAPTLEIHVLFIACESSKPAEISSFQVVIILLIVISYTRSLLLPNQESRRGQSHL
jgi:hypothetical protein